MEKKAWPTKQGLPLPQFTEEGILPIGDYILTFEELRSSALVLGPVDHSPHWDTEWRRTLVDNFEILTRQLWKCGISRVYVDGSFAEEKDHPNDIDGYFACSADRFASGDLEDDLNLLDPWKVWTWDEDQRHTTDNDSVGHLPMWHRYRVDLWPAWGWPPQIDEFGHQVGPPYLFRHTREGKPKGIIVIEREGAS